MLLCADVGSADADLASGVIACPSCGGRLGPWGHGRERAVRLHYGERAVVRPPRGPVPVLPGNAHAAAVLDGPATGRRHRGDRAGRRGSGPARHGQRAARRGTGRPAGDRAGLGCGACAPAPATCARTPRPRLAASPRAVTGPAWTRAGPLSAMPWPRSSRARGPRSPAMATPRRTSTHSSASSASPPPSRRHPAANRQVPSRASPCPHPARPHTPGTSMRFPRRVHRHHERHDDTPSTPPGEMPEMRTPCAHLQ